MALIARSSPRGHPASGPRVLRFGDHLYTWALQALPKRVPSRSGGKGLLPDGPLDFAKGVG